MKVSSQRLSYTDVDLQVDRQSWILTVVDLGIQHRELAAALPLRIPEC